MMAAKNPYGIPLPKRSYYPDIISKKGTFLEISDDPSLLSAHTSLNLCTRQIQPSVKRLERALY
jgi:hypothetical protein